MQEQASERNENMLKTEMRNENTTHIDKMSTEEMLLAIQRENIRAAEAIEPELCRIGRAVDAIFERMKDGGRLFYVGCGTSGRLGVVDAAECPPTYGVPKELVVGIIAGGYGAMSDASEGAEDNLEAGASDISRYSLTELDSVVGISAAGGAAYVLGAFSEASKAGALKIALTSNENSPLEAAADLAIHPDTGAEAVTGSTRMKAGSAHKMILNMISTSVMIKLGHVYENLMINLKPTNVKLKKRMIGIVSNILAIDAIESEKLLNENEFVIRKAIESYKNNII